MHQLGSLLWKHVNVNKEIAITLILEVKLLNLLCLCNNNKNILPFDTLLMDVLFFFLNNAHYKPVVRSAVPSNILASTSIKKLTLHMISDREGT